MIKKFVVFAILGLPTVISFDIGHCTQAQSLFALKAISATENRKPILTRK